MANWAYKTIGISAANEHKAHIESLLGYMGFELYESREFAKGPCRKHEMSGSCFTVCAVDYSDWEESREEEAAECHGYRLFNLLNALFPGVSVAVRKVDGFGDSDEECELYTLYDGKSGSISRSLRVNGSGEFLEHGEVEVSRGLVACAPAACFVNMLIEKSAEAGNEKLAALLRAVETSEADEEYLRHYRQYTRGMTLHGWAESAKNGYWDGWNADNQDTGIVTASFGSWSAGSGKSEPIEWIVLSQRDGTALMISRYPVCRRAYAGKSGETGCWQDSSLRRWLNTDFLNSAFTPQERSRIIAEDDSVFLLSREEADEYFEDDIHRVLRDKNDEVCSWWCRNDDAPDSACEVPVVDGYGSVCGGEDGVPADDTGVSVRPCVRVSWTGEPLSLKSDRYISAKELMHGKDYAGAAALFRALDGYRDSAMLADQCAAYQMRASLECRLCAGVYNSSTGAFREADGYKHNICELEPGEQYIFRATVRNITGARIDYPDFCIKVDSCKCVRGLSLEAGESRCFEFNDRPLDEAGSHSVWAGFMLGGGAVSAPYEWMDTDHLTVEDEWLELVSEEMTATVRAVVYNTETGACAEVDSGRQNLYDLGEDEIYIYRVRIRNHAFNEMALPGVTCVLNEVKHDWSNVKIGARSVWEMNVGNEELVTGSYAAELLVGEKEVYSNSSVVFNVGPKISTELVVASYDPKSKAYTAYDKNKQKLNMSELQPGNVIAVGYRLENTTDAVACVKRMAIRVDEDIYRLPDMQLEPGEVLETVDRRIRLDEGRHAIKLDLNGKNLRSRQLNLVTEGGKPTPPPKAETETKSATPPKAEAETKPATPPKAEAETKPATPPKTVTENEPAKQAPAALTEAETERIKQRIAELETEYTALETQLKEYQKKLNRITELSAAVDKLRSDKRGIKVRINSLGRFAFKDKKRLEEEFAALDEKETVSIRELNALKLELPRLVTKKTLNARMEEINAELEPLRNRLAASAAQAPAETAPAAEAPETDGGTEKTGYYYEILEDNTLMLTDYDGPKGDITVPSSIDGRTVSHIGVFALQNREFCSITVPGTVREIGGFAFKGCTGCEITLAEGVRVINGSALSNLRTATVTVPQSVAEISGRVFENCVNLTLVVNDGSYAMKYCAQRNIPCRVRAVESYEQIIAAIKAGLSGDFKADANYLKGCMEKYKTHALAKEIIRECGRLLSEAMPKDKQEELQNALAQDGLDFDAILNEVRTHIRNRDISNAMAVMEELIAKLGGMQQPEMFQNDSVSEYYTFEEPFQEMLFRDAFKPTKTLRQAGVPYSQIYLLYTYLLFETKRYKEALTAIERAVRWNPVSTQIAFEGGELFRALGDWNAFMKSTLMAFRYAYKKEDIAHCFRNLGYWFAEKQKWTEAIACLQESMKYEPESHLAVQELAYIHLASKGQASKPGPDTLKAASREYGFPVPWNVDIIKTALSWAQHFMTEDKNSEMARYCLNIANALYPNEQIQQLLDSLGD